jgi:hypothetical protein
MLQLRNSLSPLVVVKQYFSMYTTLAPVGAALLRLMSGRNESMLSRRSSEGAKSVQNTLSACPCCNISFRPVPQLAPQSRRKERRFNISAHYRDRRLWRSMRLYQKTSAPALVFVSPHLDTMSKWATIQYMHDTPSLSWVCGFCISASTFFERRHLRRSYPDTRAEFPGQRC